MSDILRSFVVEKIGLVMTRLEFVEAFFVLFLVIVSALLVVFQGLEFQPSADMSWQSWACNELNQAATYPSPYANVHKGNMDTMGGSIGHSSADLWKPYVSSDCEKHLSMVNNYLATLRKDLSASVVHSKKLAFMAENGIRQLGNPRIGILLIW